MEKTKGTTIGAVLLGALLLRPAGTVPLKSPDTRPAAGTIIAAGTEATGQGPWTASCAYWAPSRPPAGETLKDNGPAQFKFIFTGNDRKFDSHVNASKGTKSSCNGAHDRWGIPGVTKASTIFPDVTAIVASVPDPLHAHMALQFDRSIDALLQAAADNGYVVGSYWIPWRNELTTVGGGHPADSPEDTKTREQQPGLIVLKYVPVDLPTKAQDEKQTDPTKKIANLSFARVIYLFLVRNSPVGGMDGDELIRAFQYENELLELRKKPLQINVRLSPKDCAAVSTPSEPAKTQIKTPMQTSGAKKKCTELAVIGTTFSGSAASLRQGIQTALNLIPEVTRVRIAGGTSTALAATILHGNFTNNVQTRYISFGDDDRFETETLLRNLKRAGYDSDRTAFLVEDGTTYAVAAKHAADGARTGFLERARGIVANAPELTGGATASKEEREKKDRIMAALEEAIDEGPDSSFKATFFRFPRGISALRNAHRELPSEGGSGAAQSPYLRLTLQDESIDDSVPKFSETHSPVSQEAQLGAIVRRMHQMHTQIAVIQCTDVLDEIFLSKFLHQVLPDLRILTIGSGDLLYEREIDSVPFVGGVTITPYNLVAPVPSKSLIESTTLRPFSDGEAERVYNAASYIFWDGATDYEGHSLFLANYRSIFHPDGSMHASMWAVLNGRDGYYPLALLNECASTNPDILPSFGVQPEENLDGIPCKDDHATAGGGSPFPFPISPPLGWFVTCVAIISLCCIHIAAFFCSNLWSTLTRDLAIDTNDEPRKRSLYVHIGTSMLLCMAWVAAYPLFPVTSFTRPLGSAVIIAVLTIVAGFAAFIVSLSKTRKYMLPNVSMLCDTCSKWQSREARSNVWMYLVIHVIAAAATIAILFFWAHSCGIGLRWSFGEPATYERLFFSFRSLYLFSGVSPAAPVLLLLLGWYLWAYFQTRRMRFSRSSRPRMPKALPVLSDNIFFVSDNALDPYENETRPALNDGELTANITCLLITRELASRLFKKSIGIGPTAYLGLVYALIALVLFTFWHIHSPERILWTGDSWPQSFHHFIPTSYELLVEGLFLPLMFIALTGWVRMILIWSSLSGGLLRPLERSPIRFAFSKLEGLGWMAVLRQNGLVQRWREMARSLESMQQLVHRPAGSLRLQNVQYDALMHDIAILLPLVSKSRSDRTDEEKAPLPKETEGLVAFRCLKDVPDPEFEQELFLMYRIEERYAHFASTLIEEILLHCWKFDQKDFVAGRANDGYSKCEENKEDKCNKPRLEEPDERMLAEEFLAIRYLSMIRAVLVNIRELMTFVVFAFILSIVSWNSYPFRPREWVDAALTVLLLIIGTGLVWVFAQLHRDPILSRITRTEPNELGWDFYFRILAFGAAPVMTWLAYQYPSISSAVLRYIQPTIEAVK